MITEVSELFVVVHAVALDAAGRIVVAGNTDLNFNRFLLACYTPDGTLDPTFGVGGYIVTTTIGLVRRRAGGDGGRGPGDRGGRLCPADRHSRQSRRRRVGAAITPMARSTRPSVWAAS